MTTGAAKRIDGIDFWRGFALVTIFIDHAPENIFQHVTQMNFGFSDAAELFVFLSGASVALAYGSRFFRGETAAAIRAVFRRAFTLYWVQVLISLLTIAIFAAAALWWDNDDLIDDDDRDTVVSSPLRGISAILALAHQFGNVNILPLYVVLLLITPALLVLARRNDWLMLLASGLIYLAARVFALNLPSWPLDGGWYFNPLAWQFIFAIGLFVGRRLRSGGIPFDRRLFALCLAVLAGSFAVLIVPGLWADAREVLDHSKTHLGLARLVRSQVLSLREAPYITAAQASGASHRRILFWHLLPNLSNLLIVSFTLSLGAVAGAEVGLTFLGIGVQSPHPSFGAMIAEAADLSIVRVHPGLILVPATVVSALILSFNLLGDQLTDVLSPRRR